MPEKLADYATPRTGVYCYSGEWVSVKTKPAGKLKLFGLSAFEVRYKNDSGRRTVFVWSRPKPKCLH